MGRVNFKSDRLARDLRGKIISGQWGAGSRLPSRQQLEQRYRVSRNTLQRVMDQLQGDGFICANGRAGTFVADRLPHQTRYALLIPADSKPQQHRFWEALAEQARVLGRTTTRYEVAVYYGVEPGFRDQSYDRLVAEIRAHRLAGLIFAASAHNLQHTPLLEEPGIPRVVIASTAPFPALPTVFPDYAHWLERGLRRALKQGRRRIAVMACGSTRVERMLDQLAVKLGVHVPPKWRLYLSPHQTLGARHLTRLLVNASAEDRPDALLVMDDHLVEPVALGLADEGIAVPEQVHVVAHANFPYPSPSALPAERLGFDSRELLSHCLEAIDRQRRGESPEPHVWLSARFDHEQYETSESARSDPAAQQTGELIESGP